MRRKLPSGSASRGRRLRLASGVSGSVSEEQDRLRACTSSEHREYMGGKDRRQGSSVFQKRRVYRS